MTAIRPAINFSTPPFVSARPMPRAIADGRAFDALLDRRDTRGADSGSTAASFGERGMFGRHGATAMPAPSSLSPIAADGGDDVIDGGTPASADTARETPDLCLAGEGAEHPQPIEPNIVQSPMAPRLESGGEILPHMMAACEQALTARIEEPSPGRSPDRPAAILRNLSYPARPDLALISLSGSDSALMVVAHVASGSVDAGELRRRVQALAQEFGMTVAELRFTPSGQPSATPAGDRYGNRPR